MDTSTQNNMFTGRIL